jgi:hypothetical protein
MPLRRRRFKNHDRPENSENGKPAPLYDQYENHCRIDGHATKGNSPR